MDQAAKSEDPYLANLFMIDGEKYSTEGLSSEGIELVSMLKFTQKKITTLSNQHALLMKAKNAYISDIKAEVVESRSGLDVGALFTDDAEW